MSTNYINFFSILLYLSLSAYLFLKKTTSVTPRLFALLLFLHAVSNGIVSFNNSEYVASFPYLIHSGLILKFLWGPLLFLFVESSSGKKEHKPWRILIHFLPFLFALLFFSYQILTVGLKNLSEYASNKDYLFKKYTLFNFAVYIQNVFYIFLCLLRLVKHRLDIRQNYSNLQKVRFDWIFNTLVFLAAVHFLIPFMVYYLDMGYFKNLYIVNIPIVFYVAWHILRKPGMFEKEIIIAPVPEKDTTTVLQYDYEDQAVILTKLMEDKKPFLNPELTLKELADYLEIPAYQLSEILNKGLNKSFYEFVNHYRIEEAKEKLVSPKNANLTLEGIGYECGFNSKSTFYAIFKKYTQYTPLEFRKSQDIHIEQITIPDSPKRCPNL